MTNPSIYGVPDPSQKLSGAKDHVKQVRKTAAFQRFSSLWRSVGGIPGSNRFGRKARIEYRPAHPADVAWQVENREAMREIATGDWAAANPRMGDIQSADCADFTDFFRGGRGNFSRTAASTGGEALVPHDRAMRREEKRATAGRGE
jgi:hypothetical protein